MKYGIYKIEMEKLVHHFIAKLNDSDVADLKPVAEARNKSEASKLARELGQAL